MVASLCSTSAVLGSAASIGSLTSADLELASFLLVTLSTLYQFIISILIICYNITQIKWLQETTYFEFSRN